MHIKTLAVAAFLGLAAISPAQATPPMTPPESQVSQMFRANHLALRVADLDASVSWWRDVFGAREVRRSRVPDLDPDIEIVFMHISGGFHVELVGGGNPNDIGAPATIADDFGRAGHSHVGFMVADMDVALAHMSRFGVKAERRVTREDYGIELAIIREPGGRFLELYSPLPTN